MVTAYWIWPRILTQNLHPLWSSYQSIYLSICLLPAWLFVCLSVRPSVSAPHRHYQLQLELSKQKQSTDKQFTVKPPFTRHAGIGWRILLNWFNIFFCLSFLHFCLLYFVLYFSIIDQSALVAESEFQRWFSHPIDTSTMILTQWSWINLLNLHIYPQSTLLCKTPGSRWWLQMSGIFYPGKKWSNLTGILFSKWVCSTTN